MIRFARLAIAAFCGAIPFFATAATGLWIQGATGSITNGATYHYQEPAQDLTLSSNSSSMLVVVAKGAGLPDATVTIAAGSAGSLGPGAFEMASEGYPYYGTGPLPRIGLQLSGSYAYCTFVAGRFAVLEAVFDSNFQVARFAANFEIRCSGGTTYGELRIDSSVPLTIAEPPGSIAPDPFAFRARPQMKAGAVVESDVSSIYGINAPAAISISGGEYSLNGAEFTAAPGTATNRDRVRVRATAPATPGATQDAILSVGGVYSIFSVRTYLPGEPLTALVMKRSGLYGSPIDVDSRNASWTFQASRTDPHEVVVGYRGGSSSFEEQVRFGTARGAAMAAGAYELASSSGGVNALVPYFGTTGCAPDLARFAVLEYEPGPGTSVNRFAADFEAMCGGGLESPLFGEIRFNSTVPLTALKPSGSTYPSPFALVAQMPVRAGAIVNAQWISLLGVNAPVPLSISGGEYSVNGGPFTSAPGVAQPQDMVTVRGVASRVAGATQAVTLNAGGRAATLNVLAYAPTMALTGLYFRSSAGDHVGGGLTRLHLEPWSRMSLYSQYANGRMFDLSTHLRTNWYLTLAQPTGQAQLTVGTYEGASRWPNQAAGTPGLSFWGGGSCNQLAGRFVVREAEYSGSELVRFAADFEQRCEITGPPLFGEVRYKSQVPFSVLVGGTITVPLDLDGSGRSDILYRNVSTGSVYRLPMDGATVAGGAVVHHEPNLAWQVVGQGDFDGNGVTDLLWRHATNGQVYQMRFGRNGLQEGGGVVHVEPNAAWRIVATPDLDGDGKADLLWWNSASGLVWGMLLDGLTVTMQGPIYSEPDTSWRIAAVGDFAGSGKRNQLVWRNATSGQVFLMTVTRTGGTFSQAGQMIYHEPNLQWRILDAADANGDGRSDLYWRNEATGQVYLMLMSGPVIGSGGFVHTEPNLAWQVAAIGDYDGNGRADLLWRNDATGDLYMMLMDGFSIASQGLVYQEPDTAWQVLGQSFVDD